MGTIQSQFWFVISVQLVNLNFYINIYLYSVGKVLIFPKVLFWFGCGL